MITINITICSIVNTGFSDDNAPEIAAISHDLQGVGNPFVMALNGCVMVKADLSQMNILPNIVLPEPRTPDETIEAYEIRTSAINRANIDKVISASPHNVMLLESVEDFYLLTRQHGALFLPEVQ